jgi:hypothetical protein
MNKYIQIVGIVGYVLMSMHYIDENKLGNLNLIVTGYSLVAIHYMNELFEENKADKSKKTDEIVEEENNNNLFSKVTKGGYVLILLHYLMKMYKTKQIHNDYLVASIAIVSYLLQYNRIAYALFSIYYLKYVVGSAHDRKALIGGGGIALMNLYNLFSH